MLPGIVFCCCLMRDHHHHHHHYHHLTAEQVVRLVPAACLCLIQKHSLSKHNNYSHNVIKVSFFLFFFFCTESIFFHWWFHGVFCILNSMAFTLYCILTQPKWFPVIPLAIREEYCMDGLREMQTTAFWRQYYNAVKKFHNSAWILSDYVEEDNAYTYIYI